jgi:hypothetical protein
VLLLWLLACCVGWQVPMLLLLLLLLLWLLQLLLRILLLAVLRSQECRQPWALSCQQLLLVALRCSSHVFPHLPPAHETTCSSS